MAFDTFLRVDGIEAESAVTRYEIKIHTYCLMTNHYHFLIETPHANLSQAIKWANVGYVKAPEWLQTHCLLSLFGANRYRMKRLKIHPRIL